MSNDYYAASFASAHTLARASDVLAQLQAIETGLDLLPTKIRLRTGTVMWCDDDTGAADAYVITTPVTTNVTYIDGLFVRFRAKNANTGASTVNVNGLGVKAIRRYDGSALTSGDITDEQIVDAVYDADRGYFVMVGALGGVATAAAASAAAALVSEGAASTSASNASSSAAAALASQTAAAVSAAAAAVSAAAINLPSSMVGKTLNMLRVNAGETGHEYRTPAEVLADIGALGTAAAAAAYQPLDSDLTAIAALSTTSYGRAFLALADATAGRSALSLGTAATQNTSTSGANVPLMNGANTWSALQTLSSGLAFANETLSTYDEGIASNAWTPGITFGGAATGVTYTTQTGGFIKIGRFVFAWFNLTLSSKGSSTGAAKITGLPFTAANPSGEYPGMMIPNYVNSLNLGASYTMHTGLVDPNATTITLAQIGDNVAAATTTDADVSNTTRVQGVAVYTSAS